MLNSDFADYSSGLELLHSATARALPINQQGHSQAPSRKTFSNLNNLGVGLFAVACVSAATVPSPSQQALRVGLDAPTASPSNQSHFEYLAKNMEDETYSADALSEDALHEFLLLSEDIEESDLGDNSLKTALQIASRMCCFAKGATHEADPTEDEGLVLEHRNPQNDRCVSFILNEANGFVYCSATRPGYRRWSATFEYDPMLIGHMAHWLNGHSTLPEGGKQGVTVGQRYAGQKLT
jgi:hypothetical protein